jgi:hypothetical protein
MKSAKEMFNTELKQVLETIAGNLAECRKFHPEFENPMTAAYVQSHDGTTKYYVITLDALQELINHALESIPTRSRIDEKHHIANNRIIKTTNGQPIPDDEPRILFRGRDNLALPMLRFYRQLCVDAGCNDFQLASIDVMITEFEAFAETSPTMKQPGITRGK